MLRSWYGNLLLLAIKATVLLCLLSTVACYDDQKNLIPSYADLILLPLNPEVEDGHWLTLNCTILPHYTGNFTNHDLYFRHNNVNFTNFTVVGSKTALLKMQWTLTDDSVGGGHISCALPDRTFVLSAVQHVTVVRRPLKPSLTDCLLWNWKRVNCTWQPSVIQQQQHMHTFTPLIQTLQWKFRDDVNDVWQDAACQGEVSNSCVWNVSHVINRFMKSESCCVRVFARVSLTYLHFEVESVQFCFHPVRNVILDKPRNVTVINTYAHQMLVQWQAPLLDWNHVSSMDIVYAVVVISQWSDTPVINQSLANQSLSVSSMPHTRYAISVKVKTAESHYWSTPTFLNLTTAPAMPKMSPPSVTSAFTVSHVEKHTRTVILYWQRLSIQDYYGTSLNYVVQMRKPPELHWNELKTIISADLPCTEVYVERNADVELTVVARNEVGETLPDVVMHLPAAQSSPMTSGPFVEFVVELTNDSTVIWSWQLESSEHVNANLTLFWCRSHFPLDHHQCVDDIRWWDIAASELEHKLTIDADDTYQYHYGAALNVDDIYVENSGIKWATCLYNVNGFAAPVQNVRASVPSFGHPGQLLVTWDHPSCDSNYQHGYVKSLMLYYCQYAGTECVDEPSRVPLSGYLTAYNLTGLVAGEEYGVWLYSLSRAGQSPTHSNVTVVVTSASVMTPALIAGVTVGLVVIIIVTVVVFWVLCKKYCRRCRDKLWPPVAISVPPARDHQSNTYIAASSSPMPILEYSRISYTRQGSRLSSSSRDSGQFGIASGSPLMSPGSGSEFAELPITAPDNHIERQHKPLPDSVRPAATTTYVNDEVVVLRHPTRNNHHRPSSSTTGHPEFIPLKRIRPCHRDETVASKFPPTAVAAADDDDEDDAHVTDSLMKSRLNGGHDIVGLRQSSDYIQHEWMKM